MPWRCRVHLINPKVDLGIFNLRVDCTSFNLKVDSMDIIRIPGQLGPMLRAARLQHGWTQADVARQLGITAQAVSKLENQAGRASFDRIHRLCLLLGLELGLQPRSAGMSKGTGAAKAAW